MQPAAITKVSLAKSYLKLLRFDNLRSALVPTTLLLSPVAITFCLFSGKNNAKHDGYAALNRQIPIFICGAFTMRSLGCIVNDFFDRGFDKFVKRTEMRPLANNMLSVQQILLPTALCGISSIILLFNLKLRTILLGLGVVPMVFSYPLMKRFTKFAQVFLGFTFNWGVILAASECSNDDYIPLLSLLPIYCASIFWTVLYDTVYAFQDLKYDVKLGLKSMAMLRLKYPKLFLNFCSISSATLYSLASYQMLGIDVPLFTFPLSAFINQRMISKLNLHNSASCGNFFLSSAQVGLLMIFGCAIPLIRSSLAINRQFDT